MSCGSRSRRVVHTPSRATATASRPVRGFHAKGTILERSRRFDVGRPARIIKRGVLSEQTVWQLGTKPFSTLRGTDEQLLGLEIESVVIRPTLTEVRFWFRTGRTLRVIEGDPTLRYFTAISDDGKIVSCRNALHDFQEPLLCLGRTSEWQADMGELVERAGCTVAVTRVMPV